ncbi:MAG TPA: segregation/condensation protein A [Clostridiaceae bacterium]|nr:segregation/condensation protein A [Clostridiaceae bacterium]
MLSALSSDAYKIKIKNFEGPLDLLFHLIEKNKINIYDIPISEITDQYMDYIFAMQKMNLELASEFLVMAATLLHIKSKILLPVKKDEEKEDSAQEGLDPREELVERLIEYKKYKDLAAKLEERERLWTKVFYKQPERIDLECQNKELELSPDINKLKDTYIDIIKRNELKENKRSDEMQQIIQKEKVTIKSKIRHIMSLLFSKKFFIFDRVFSLKEKSITEIVTAFMALLIVVKSGKANVEQKKQYSDIFVSLRD